MNREKFDAFIINEMDMVCYVSDMETHELVYLTPPGMRLFGISSEEEYRGKKCYEVLQGLNAPCPFCTNASLKRGEKLCWEHFNEKLGRWAEIEDTAADIDGRMCRIEFVRDITAKSEELRRISDRLTTEEALVRCIKALSEETDTECAVNRFLQTVMEYYKANRAYIMEADYEAGCVDNTYERCADGVASSIDLLQRIPMAFIGHWFEKFDRKGEFFISSLYDDLDPEGEDFRLLQAQNIESLAVVPFRKDGKVIGFLGVDDPTENLGKWTLLHSAVTFIMQELDKRRLIRQLEYAGYTDTLTGLKNRNNFNKTLADMGDILAEDTAVVYVDLDNLKKTNDVCGHRVGDEHIVTVAKILGEAFAGFDVFRTGGDEFMVLATGCEKSRFEEAQEELHARTKEADISCSYGVRYGKKGEKISALMESAETEMYRHKSRHHKSRTVSGGNA